jgi:hypothetical protein
MNNVMIQILSQEMVAQTAKLISDIVVVIQWAKNLIVHHYVEMV